MVPESVPRGVELTHDLGTLRITFPGGVSLKQTPVPQSGWRIFAALFAVFSPLALWSAVGMIASIGGWAAVLDRMWFVLLAVFLTCTNCGLGLHIMQSRTVSIEAATQTRVELRPHSLWISSEEILLEHIEKVTVDKAGARMRVEGRNRYLLPSRSDEERAWLAGLIREAITRRGAAEPTSDDARARLEALLQRT